MSGIGGNHNIGRMSGIHSISAMVGTGGMSGTGGNHKIGVALVA